MTSSLSEYARRVREEADIVEIIGTVVPLKRTGVNYKGLCPFHREKTPSFTVHPANQRFKCFGCGAGGDVIRFWMMHERLSYPEALEQMGRRLGLEPPRMAGRTEEDHDEQRRRNLLGIHEFAMEWFEHHLQSADAVHAREYLKKRGLTPADIKTFRLGYAPDEWDAFGETARRKGYSQQLLLDSGLAVLGKKGNPYDRFRGRIIFPIMDLQGRCIAFGGRIMGSGEPKYLNSPETEIYRKGRTLYGMNLAREQLKGTEPALLVEGYMDMIALYRGGFHNVVASLGTALTDDHAKLLKRFTSKVIFIYDGDEAGQKAMLRGLEALLAQSMSVKVVVLPGEEDPDSHIVKHGSAAFRKLIDNALDFLEFFLDAGAAKHDIRTPEGKIAVLDMVQPALGKVREPILMADYIHRLAERLKIREDLALRHLKGRGHEARGEAVEEIRSESGEKPALIEMGFLKLIVERSELRGMAAAQYEPEWISCPPIRRLAGVILEDAETRRNFNDLDDQCENDEERRILNDAAFMDMGNIDPKKILSHLVDRLRVSHERRERSRLVKSVAKLGSEMNEEAVALLEEIHHKSREIWETRKPMFRDDVTR